MKFHFNNKKRPTLCAYCKAPASAFLYYDGAEYLGACNMDHLEKLKTERLPNKAQLNDDGVEYAILQTKDIYLKLTREEHNKPLHEWNRDKRKKVFTSIVREYLNWANDKAQKDDLRAINGSKEILSKRGLSDR